MRSQRALDFALSSECPFPAISGLAAVMQPNDLTEVRLPVAGDGFGSRRDPKRTPANIAMVSRMILRPGHLDDAIAIGELPFDRWMSTKPVIPSSRKQI